MTYDDIISALQRGKCIETIAALERAVEAERDELHKLHPLRAIRR